MSNKELALATYKALQERKRRKEMDLAGYLTDKQMKIGKKRSKYYRKSNGFC